MPVSKVYKHTDTNDTKCKILDKSEIHVGDEFYYLHVFICLVFHGDLKKFINEYYRKFQLCTICQSLKYVQIY